MPTTKRLLIQTTSNNSSDNQIIPVNTGSHVEVTTDIGKFTISVFIKNFDGSQKHKANSLYNCGDHKYLNGEAFDSNVSSSVPPDLPNLRIFVKWTPNKDIQGSELLFGNDCSVSINEYIPTTLISTGLRLFTWFMNTIMKSDLYGDHPYIFGLALNSFTKMSIADSTPSEFMSDSEEHLIATTNADPIPRKSTARRDHFRKLPNAEKFLFKKDTPYFLVFDTNFIKLADSKYCVSIPSFKNSTFDINVLRFANEKLNNFNWVVKKCNINDAEEGELGLVLNFALVDEES